MAIIHRATLTPGKLEVLADWVPTQPWGAGATGLEALGAYRFDDPDGAVGLEVHLLRAADGRILQVPLTYRDAPRDGVPAVATMQHSALGRRWVYDGCGDPVFVAALITAIRCGGTEATLEFADGGARETTTKVRGSGSARRPRQLRGELVTVEHGDVAALDLAGAPATLLRTLTGDASGPSGAETLAGVWPGQDQPVLLAFLR